MKTILIIVGVIILLVILGGAGFWYMSQQPLYKPGMVRDENNLNAPLEAPTQPDESDVWRVEADVELAHFSEGQGRNILVVHGGPGMPFTEPVSGLSLLSADYQIHYYAQRGCGASSRPIDRFDSKNMYANMQTLDRTLGVGAQIADIERIRQILGDEKLILIGHSWGGLLASLYAVEFPEHVEALILVSPANMLVMPQIEADSDLFASVRAQLPPEEHAEYDAFMKDYFDFGVLFEKSDADLVAMNEQFGEYYVRIMGEKEDETGAPIPEQGRPGGWMVWAQYISLGQRYDLRPALEDVSVPVLVIHGAKDLQSEAASHLYVDAFSNAEFVVIDAASHFAFGEQPEEFARIAIEFLNK
jgi:proline iminopeptidase